MDNSESDFTDFTIGIIGLGLMGGSYAKALNHVGVQHIIGIDKNLQTVEQALAENLIEMGDICGNNALKKADLLIFCLSASDMIEFIRKYQKNFKPDVILTDIAGIKGNTIHIIQQLLCDEMDFIPGHPMAGKEGSGLSQSDASVFQGANYILIPQEKNKTENIRLIARIAKEIGCGHVICVTAEEHDRMIAYTSSLPHVVATALVNSNSMDARTKYFVAGSFRDGTRVADINALLWTQLFMANRQNLLEEINRFKNSLEDFTELLVNSDKDKMMEYLEKAAVRRRELTSGKHTG
ncbi:prephenate dehydrogenase [Megasphaera sueciensis]|uniref:prephenate dehydrogenase n=1 Tax=Megasphaera sueciensis TaxID=349094 RepID=UPI003CFFA303